MRSRAEIHIRLAPSSGRSSASAPAAVPKLPPSTRSVVVPGAGAAGGRVTRLMTPPSAAAP
jgi:hypothetical protein